MNKCPFCPNGYKDKYRHACNSCIINFNKNNCVCVYVKNNPNNKGYIERDYYLVKDGTYLVYSDDPELYNRLLHDFNQTSN